MKQQVFVFLLLVTIGLWYTQDDRDILAEWKGGVVEEDTVHTTTATTSTSTESL